VIFDCDGVLVESEKILVAAELDYLSKAGLAFDRNDYIRRFMGMPVETWEKLIRQDLSKHTTVEPGLEFFMKLHKLTKKKMKEELVAVTGARASIEQLGIEICVASSSSPEELEWKLQLTNLIDLFEPHLFSTHLVKNGKPAPDLFLYAAKKMNKHPSHCVVVEDSTNGVLAAKRAGMKVIGFTAGSHCPANHGASLEADGADTIVNSYDQLPAVVMELLSG